MSKPSLQVKVKVVVDNVESEVWKKVPRTYVKVGDNWEECYNVYVKVDNTWKAMYSYSVGDWITTRSCTKACKDYTYDQRGKCFRTYADSSSIEVDDEFCTKAGLSLTQTGLSCGSNSCLTCSYSTWNSGQFGTGWQIYKTGTDVYDAKGEDVIDCTNETYRLFILENSTDSNSYIYSSPLYSDMDSVPSSVPVNGTTYSKGEFQTSYTTGSCSERYMYQLCKS